MPDASTNPSLDDAEERETARLLKLDDQVDKAKPVVADLGRLEGEGKNAYNRRVKAETREIIKRERQDRENPEKRARKKDFLNNKKKLKKNRKKRRVWELEQGDNDQSNNTVGDDGGDKAGQDGGGSEGGILITGEQAVAARAAATAVQFGEQAERPPIFRQLPRGAAKLAASKNGNNKKKGSPSRCDGMNAEEVQAEQLAMEQMRKKVQAQYSLIKRKRKRAGDFHL